MTENTQVTQMADIVVSAPMVTTGSMSSEPRGVIEMQSSRVVSMPAQVYTMHPQPAMRSVASVFSSNGANVMNLAGMSSQVPEMAAMSSRHPVVCTNTSTKPRDCTTNDTTRYTIDWNGDASTRSWRVYIS
ncbi:hypothetical protein Sjap_015296 [Stephania japonica]|uniref:Uncharacterized protein n=1 Tax=Stephania japonica TaxID=461633 RepID=A0AAP0NSD3_9MAGN